MCACVPVCMNRRGEGRGRGFTLKLERQRERAARNPSFLVCVSFLHQHWRNDLLKYFNTYKKHNNHFCTSSGCIAPINCMFSTTCSSNHYNHKRRRRRKKKKMLSYDQNEREIKTRDLSFHFSILISRI